MHLLPTRLLLVSSLALFSYAGLAPAEEGLNPAPGVAIPTDDMGVRIFSKVPPVGVHPRVLMSPEDIEPWRKSVGLTNVGKEFFSKRYHSAVVEQLASVDESIADQALCDKFHALGGGNSAEGNEVLYAVLDVMYHPEDKDTSEKVCRAVTTFARLILARSTYDSRFYAKGVDSGLGQIDNRGGESLALSYDFLFNDMNLDQRNTCRKAIALAVKDLKTWGMGFPPGRDVTNWDSYHSVVALMHWSIEGEEGYDPKDLNSFLSLLQNWFNNCFYAGGGGNEDGYMANTSLREGTMAMIGWARRGHNLFRDPAYQAYWRWMIQSLIPTTKPGAAGVPYACNSATPYESMPTLSRWAMPGNPLVNYYFYRFKGKNYDGKKSWEYRSVTMLFASNWADTPTTPLDPAKLGLPLTDYFPELGLMTIRSDWSDSALDLNFESRLDAWQNRHEGADRGRFVLSGLGREWIGGKWNNNNGSETDSLVNIDGLAELEKDTKGAKVPNGNIIAHFDSPQFAIGCMDLKRCYDWKWLNTFKNPGDGWEPETTPPADLGWVWPTPALPKSLYGADDPEHPAYGFLGMNYWRKPSNPVKYAFRTCAMARGPHPYTLVVDDIQKDGETHNYSSNLEIMPDIDLVTSTDQGFFLSSQDPATTGRMYVKVISPTNITVTSQDYTLPGRSEKSVPHRRVVVSATTIIPAFKMLFIPLQSGEDAPSIQNDPAGTTTSITWADQKDVLSFTPDKADYTQVTVTRNGKTLFSGFPSVKIYPSASIASDTKTDLQTPAQ